MQCKGRQFPTCPFELLQSENFQREFERSDRETQENVNKVILNEIQINPENFALMKYEYAGIREVRIGKQLRLLFAICDECRELRTELIRCSDCNELDQNSIKLLTLFSHKKRYPRPQSFMK